MKKSFYELLGLTLLLVASTLLIKNFVYPLLDLPSDGPNPGRTLILLGLIMLFMKRSGTSWRSYGLYWPFKWYWLIPIALLIMVTKNFMMQPLADWLKALVGVPIKSDYSFFAHLEGNEVALVIWIVIAWGVGGFAEEMIFRGYLMNRISEVLGDTRRSLILACITQAILFGLAHYYANWGAVIATFLTGLLFGASALIFRKSLWPAIIAHGVWDMIGIYFFYQNGVI